MPPSRFPFQTDIWDLPKIKRLDKNSRLKQNMPNSKSYHSLSCISVHDGIVYALMSWH